MTLAQAASPVELTQNIAYAPGTDYPYGNRLLDVYRPTTLGLHPVLVWVHGGG
jgi:acetyl esterase/lipase